MKTWNCGHERSPENSWRGGNTFRCAICQSARVAAQKAATQERKDRVAALYLEGATIADLARQFDLARGTVRRFLLDCGVVDRDRVQLSNGRMIRDPLFVERALKLAAELAGANVPQLISNWRSPKILVHARWAVMAAMRARGVSTPQIGKRLRRDHSSVVYGLQQAHARAACVPEFAELMARVDAA